MNIRGQDVNIFRHLDQVVLMFFIYLFFILFESLISELDRNCWMLVRTILSNVMELYCIGMCNSLC